MEWLIKPPKYSSHNARVLHFCQESQLYKYHELSHIYVNPYNNSEIRTCNASLECIFCGKKFPEDLITQLKLICL